MKKTVKLMKLDKNAIMPKFAKQGDSGFDMYTLEDTIIRAGETKLIKTGIAADLEEGYEIQIRPRSGVSLNGMKGCFRKELSYINICGLNIIEAQKGDFIEECQPYLRVQFGTCDSGYKGDIGIITYNQENYDVLIPKGTRLAQSVVMEVPRIQLVEVFELSESERGNTGFGSSGTR